MKTLEQLEKSVLSEDLSAGEFRTLLNSNDLSYYEGWDEHGDFIFYLLDEPDTIFIFSDVDGYSLGVATFEW